MTYNILIVDDDVNEISILKQFLERKIDCKAELFDNGRRAIDELTSGSHTRFDLVILDLCMPGISGIDVLLAIRPVHPGLPVIVRTGRDSSHDAVEALKAGANDFINKTDTPSGVERTVKSALISSKLERDMARFRANGNNKRAGFSDILGESPQVKTMIECARKAADSDVPALMTGESGTGKELLARAIHNNSARAGKPFVIVNCGAIPDTLTDSTLFGHEKGAFSGAIYKSVGKIREADGGTLFLDEVSALSPETQLRLLTLLQTGEMTPLGAEYPVKTDVRVISATNGDLCEEMRRGKFREDLYYRLNIYPVSVPPLRERAGDIPVLVRYYVSKFSQIEAKFVRELPSQTLRLLENYSWPGNIRQLKNIIYRAIVLSESSTLETDCFPQISSELQEAQIQDGAGYKPAGEEQEGTSFCPVVLPLLGKNGHFRTVEDIEKEAIRCAMKHYHGCISEVARRLGLGRSTLYRKMRKYDIDHGVYPLPGASNESA